MGRKKDIGGISRDLFNAFHEEPDSFSESGRECCELVAQVEVKQRCAIDFL